MEDLSARSSCPDAFDDFDVELLRALAAQVGNAMEAAALAEARSAAERLRVLGQLSAGVAHHINNESAAIEFALTSAMSGIGSSDHRFLEIGWMANRGIADTVRRIREYVGNTKNEAGQRVDLATLGAGAVRLTEYRWREQAEADGVAIELETSLRPGSDVMAAREQLQEVVINLIVNAADSILDGGKIRVESGRENGQSWLSVADSGIGMDTLTLGRIFEPFFTTKGFGGQGLGLSSARTLVWDRGGKLTVRSSPGEGSTFTIMLTTATAPETSAAKDDAKVASDIAGKSILVIDDQVMLRISLPAILESQGCKVEEASGGDEALQVFASASTMQCCAIWGCPEWMAGKSLPACTRSTRLARSSS